MNALNIWTEGLRATMSFARAYINDATDDKAVHDAFDALETAFAAVDKAVRRAKGRAQ